MEQARQEDRIREADRIDPDIDHPLRRLRPRAPPSHAHPPPARHDHRHDHESEHAPGSTTGTVTTADEHAHRHPPETDPRVRVPATEPGRRWPRLCGS